MLTLGGLLPQDGLQVQEGLYRRLPGQFILLLLGKCETLKTEPLTLDGSGHFELIL